MPDVTEIEAFLRRHLDSVFGNDVAEYHATTALIPSWAAIIEAAAAAHVTILRIGNNKPYTRWAIVSVFAYMSLKKVSYDG